MYKSDKSCLVNWELYFADVFSAFCWDFYDGLFPSMSKIIGFFLLLPQAKFILFGDKNQSSDNGFAVKQQII